MRKKKDRVKETVAQLADSLYVSAEKNSALIGAYLKKHQRKR